VLQIQPDNSVLRSPNVGESLADEISHALRDSDKVCVDFACVENMSPSFANAFIMTLLADFPLSELRARCEFVNRSESVVDMMNRAIRRFQSGIRLTTQRPHAAIPA